MSYDEELKKIYDDMDEATERERQEGEQLVKELNQQEGDNQHE